MIRGFLLYIVCFIFGFATVCSGQILRQIAASEPKPDSSHSPLDSNKVLLIIKSEIDSLRFSTNHGQTEVLKAIPGEWHVQLEPGTHRITFSAEGFQSHPIRITFPQRNRAQQIEVFVPKLMLASDLKPSFVIPEDTSKVLLVVKSVIRNLVISKLDSGQFSINKVTEGEWRVQIDPGEHYFFFSADGFQSLTKKINIPKQEKSSEIEMVPFQQFQQPLLEMSASELRSSTYIPRNPTIVALIVESVIRNLKFNSSLTDSIPVRELVNGRWALLLEPKRQIITFSAIGFKSISKLIYIPKEVRSKAIEIYIERPEPLPGFLSVISIPEGADLIIDGKLQDKTNASFSISSGEHFIELEKDNYETIGQEIEILPNDTLELKIPLPPLGMVLIRGDRYEMGNSSDDAKSDEKPVHTVTVNDFFLSQHEVTNDEFVEFLNEIGNERDGQNNLLINLKNFIVRERSGIDKARGTYYVKKDFNDHPAVFITWYGAKAFAAWKGGRLPTEAEWEYAARKGGENILYPTGEAINHNSANYNGKGDRDEWNWTAPVKSFPPNHFGLFDLAGNVWEWCEDWYNEEYYKKSPIDNPQGPSMGSKKVLRGGHYENAAKDLRCTKRDGEPPEVADHRIGFRYVIDVPKLQMLSGK